MLLLSRRLGSLLLVLRPDMPKFYAVRKGRQTGIFLTWEECKLQTNGVPRAEFKSFKSRHEAEEYLGGGTGVGPGILRADLASPQQRTLSSKAGGLSTQIQSPFDTPSPAFKRKSEDSGFRITPVASRKDALALAAATQPPSPDGAPASEGSGTKRSRNDHEARPSLADLSVENGTFTLEFDGASKGNPGVAGAGAALKDPSGTTICYILQRFSRETCNFAEYSALILGLKEAHKRGISNLLVKGDSELVIRQCQGLYAVKSSNLAPLADKAKRLMKNFKHVTLKHVFREKNRLADKLSNDAIEIADVSPLVCLPYLSDEAYS